ncbi:MAG: protein jag, partial [Epsilonproteobacteria bacterium]|nr:protein jag [Campylobacterota bacterium]
EEPILEQKEEIEDKEITNESNDIQEEVDTPEIIVDSFFKSDIEPKSQKKSNNQLTSLRSEPKEVQKVIQEKLKNLLDSSCFDVDRIEVEIKDSVAHIFIDGNDAALLIGKEGYRYNALSYLLFNWINQEFGLFVKLEIAQFLQNQQEMIKALLKPIIENIKQEGYGKTPTFDGVLAQLVLEELRREFPNKYVAIKRNKEGEKYIIVNEFNKPNE